MPLSRPFGRYRLRHLWFVVGAGLGTFSTAQATMEKLLVSNANVTVYRVETADGRLIDKTVIHGPSQPPAGFDLQRQAVALPTPSKMMGTNSLTVPAYTWVFGCSAVSGAMIAAFYDRTTHPNIYTGPTNGGQMPLDNTPWPVWSDGFATYPNCPLIASKDGVDGRVGRGSIDDYWVKYESTLADPYISGPWSQHTWGTAIGDYMKTSQSGFGNTDGSTAFYTWTTSAAPLTAAEMELYGVANQDGTYGRKLFYEARRYTTTACYSQKTDNTIAGGFSFAQYKAEIDAGHPVMLNLNGHTVVGVGYDDTTNTVYLHDTWDTAVHTMIWGTSYGGMALQSVSIVHFVDCDLNGDGHVDLKDTARIARSFGTATGDPLFESAYDLNGDGAINEQDATILFNALD